MGTTSMILKSDSRGRVRTPPEQREALLAEFERSGLSASKFSTMVGVRYQTFATWVQKHRQQRAPASKRGCSVPFLDWTDDKLAELIQDKAPIHPARMLCECAAQVSSSVARRGRSEAVTGHPRGRRPNTPLQQAA